MIKCISRYSSSLGAFKVGDVIEQAALIAALMADSPASFAPVEAEPVAEIKAADDEPPAPVAVVQKPMRTVRRKG